MKRNRLINNANIILNNNNFQKNFLSHSPSFLSLSNTNENNKSNVSMTTNASAVKINSPRNYNNIAPPTSPKSNNLSTLIFDKSLSRSGSMGLFSPTSFRMKAHQLNLIEKADDILKERLKNKNVIIPSSKKYKHKALRISKDISLKNYIINLLQIKRTDINNKERMMNNALIEFSEQFNIDYKAFLEYVEDVRKKQKIFEDLVINLKKETEKTEKILSEKMFEYKRLEDFTEKMLKLIYSANVYAIFFHKVFELPFNYNNLPELNRNYKIDEIVEIIINIYETKDKNVPLPSIINDENLLMQKYIEIEDIILHSLHNRDIIINEIQKNNESYKKEIKILENNYKEYVKDLHYLQEEMNIVKKSMKGLKVQENDDIEEYIDYIIELGKEIIDTIPIKNLKNNNGYILYCRKVVLTLEEKEVRINKYINEIESILYYGEKNDQNLVESCIIETKKINKKENQMKLKRKKEQLENEKNARYMKRAQRMVIKGRHASPIFPLIKHVRRLKKVSLNKNNEEIECIYSVTDDEK